MNETTRIIGIDPGLRNTGWGVIESDGVRLTHIASGVIKPDPDLAMGDRLSELYQILLEAITFHKPIEASVEETFMNNNPRSAIKLGQARGIALLVPAKCGLPVAEYSPNQIKKTVIGSGHGDKAQIKAMIGYLLPKAKPKSDDEADALAIAICHAHQRKAKALAYA